MDELEVAYFDPKHPGSYSGADKLHRSVKGSTRKEVKHWLRKQDAYTMHRPVRYKFPRNKVIVSGIDFLWDSDLMDMAKYRDKNEGYTFVLIAIDILSHFCWTRALKNKTGAEVKKAFESIFSDGRQPQQIRTDRGTEYTNSLVEAMFRARGIHHFLTNNEVKANYAERVIRTLKLKISRYFTHKNTYTWITVLSDITDSYNRTYHRTIRMKPIDVTIDNQNEVWQKQYGGPSPFKSDGPFKLEIGDYARISHLRRPFQREYDERYTGEIFKVETRKKRSGLNVYTLVDFQGENVKGTFYEPELQKIIADLEGVFKIDKVIRTRRRKGHEKEYLVRWQHWPDKFNSWVKASDMHDI